MLEIIGFIWFFVAFIFWCMAKYDQYKTGRESIFPSLLWPLLLIMIPLYLWFNREKK